MISHRRAGGGHWSSVWAMSSEATPTPQHAGRWALSAERTQSVGAPLGLGLMLFCLHALSSGRAWHMAPLRWLRAVGDVVFVAGVVLLAWFVVGLSTDWSYADTRAARPVRLSSRHPVRGA